MAADLKQQRATIEGRRIASATSVQDLQREQRQAEREVELVSVRRTRDEERLNSGAVRNPKDLESLQHELVALKRRIASLEDTEIDVMERLEAAQTELDTILIECREIDAKIEATQEAVDTVTTQIDADIAEARRQREVMAEAIPQDLLALYEKVREQRGGMGAALLRARRCEGCRLELNNADLREIADAPRDSVVRCPECSRILVRTEESGL